jgi:hypothetical protein
MKPALLIPYKNRRSYLEMFLDKVPRYLEAVNGIRDYVIYVAEQTSCDVFNAALSRNVAARFALAENEEFSYFIFHNVDVIPIDKIDYGPRDYDVAWFMDAGSCKVRIDSFLKANGYNPHFVGWGGEDTEFYHRLSSLNCVVKEWHRTTESSGAVLLNLEMPSMSASEALGWSMSYFGHEGDGPLFQPVNALGGEALPERYDKCKDFFLPEYVQRNDELWKKIYGMAVAEKLQYFKANGLNLVDISRVFVQGRAKKMVWLKYESNEVLSIGEQHRGSKGQ